MPLERRILEGGRRGLNDLGHHTRGHLGEAAAALRRCDGAVGIITGFYVPDADQPAAETDGPIGAVQLAAALLTCDITVRVATDDLCAPVVGAALAAAGLEARVELDVIAVGDADRSTDVDNVRTRWRSGPKPVREVVSIERCGPARCGRPRNVRGLDLLPWTGPMHELFASDGWGTTGIGDGGNELGMGRLPSHALHQAMGEAAAIACTVPADRLILAAVSNWAGLALALEVAGDHREARAAVRAASTLNLLPAMLAAGAIDGLTRQRDASVDGLPVAEHEAVEQSLLALTGESGR